MSCGVYKIINTETDKVYVGSSKNIEKRIDTHFKLLRAKKHHSVKLQNSYNVHGTDSFKYEVVALCEIEDLFEVEQYWIDKLDSYHQGYNASESSRCPSNKYSLSILEKNKKHIETLIYNLCEIQDMKDEVPTDVFISCIDIGSASDGKLRFHKYIKATEIVKSLLSDTKSLDKNQEYMITHINYSSTSFNKYRFSPVGDKSQLKKQHNMYKTNFIYDQVVQSLLAGITDNKYGLWVLDEMGRRGLAFPDFRMPLIAP